MTITVACVKHGKKYSADYVNKLHNAVKRHLPEHHDFVCFTDDADDILCDYVMLPQIQEISGWWWKLYLFKSGLFSDTVLYLDLDMVVVDDLTKFISYKPDSFVGMRDVFRAINPACARLGSAVMKWNPENVVDLWDLFLKNRTHVIKNYYGDQDWIWATMYKQISFFPDNWIRSYKWEIRSKNELIRTNEGWAFNRTRNPDIPDGTSILAFHGTPSLHSVTDGVIMNHWQ